MAWWYDSPMGLPAELLDALDSLSAEGPTAPAETSAKEEPRPALDFARGRFLRATKRLHEHLDALEAKSRSVTEAASHLIAAASLSEGFDFDAVVDVLETREEDLKETFLPELLQAKKRRKELTSVPPELRAMAKETADRQIKTYSDILKTVRDTRWQLMALRAKRESAGDAPVFSNAADLLQYLNAK